LEQGGGDDTVGEKRETDGADPGQRAGQHVNPAGIEAVGQAGEDGHGDHVAAEKCSTDEPGLGVADAPGVPQQSQERRVGREARHAQHLGQAHQADDAEGTGGVRTGGHGVAA